MSRADRLFRWYGVSAAWVTLYHALLFTVGLEPAEGYRWSLILALSFWIVFGLLYVAGRFYWLAFKGEKSARALVRRLRTDLLSRETAERLMTLLFMMFLSVAMFDAFSAWKQAIPQFHPYRLDATLASVDQGLHFGVDPWRFTHAFLGWATPAMDLWYLWAWWPAKLALLAGILTWDGMRRRARFLLGHLMLWTIAGTALAIPLASGGPVYYEAFVGDPDRFSGLIAALARSAPNALRVQADLWHAFQGLESPVIGRGISAMPSLHVGATALAACWGWNIGRWPGVLLTMWAIITALVSVHLGWHYAIDGYVGSAVAIGCWWLAGRIVGVTTGGTLDQPGLTTTPLADPPVHPSKRRARPHRG